MKTNLSKMIMTIVAIMLAIGGSFVSHASEKKTFTILPGYINPIFSFPCTNVTSCSNIAGRPFCTVTYQGHLYQAFGRQSPGDPYCDTVLFRLP